MLKVNWNRSQKYVWFNEVGNPILSVVFVAFKHGVNIVVFLSININIDFDRIYLTLSHGENDTKTAHALA